MHFFLAACQGAGLAVAAGALAGAPGRRGTLGTVLLIAAVIGGALLFGASLAEEDHPAWPGWPVGALIAAGAFTVVCDFSAAAAARADGGGLHRRPARARGAGHRGALGDRPPVRPRRAARDRLPRPRPPRPRGAQVRGPAVAAVSARKLVLCVVDSLRTDILERAAADGSAPTFAALLDRGELIRDCVSSFPSVTPVCTSSITTGQAPDGHWISGMNWYHRTERRYVEYGSSFEATRAFGLFRSLYDTVYNMNMAHLSDEVETVFESLGDHGDPHGLHAVSDLPRPHPPRDGPRGAAAPRSPGGDLPPRDLGPRRALLRRALYEPQGPLPADPRPPRDPRRVLRLLRSRAGGQRPLRLPSLLAARQRLPLAQARAGGPGRVDRPRRCRLR